MAELHSVISSQIVDDLCPRFGLGRLCLVEDGFDCVCQYVDGATVEQVADDDGKVIGLRLTTTAKRGADPTDIERSLDMTGFKAKHVGNGRVTESFFDYRWTINAELKNLSL